jgi:hypothetical protein
MAGKAMIVAVHGELLFQSSPSTELLGHPFSDARIGPFRSDRLQGTVQPQDPHRDHRAISPHRRTQFYPLIHVQRLPDPLHDVENADALQRTLPGRQRFIQQHRHCQFARIGDDFRGQRSAPDVVASELFHEQTESFNPLAAAKMSSGMASGHGSGVARGSKWGLVMLLVAS